MKTIQSKSLLTLIIIFFIIGFSTSAKNIMGNDSKFYYDSIPLAAISSTNNIENTLVKNPEWVAYPSSLQEHRNESKDYVKRYSTKERSYIIHMFNKGKSFFSKATKIFDKYNVPFEFQMLPVLESDFNANAISPAGAVGYWQFMSQLAREYGLSIGGRNDERKSFSKSTVAAAKYFRDQLAFFNDDVLLTVAAYNCGQGRVKSALKKSRKADADFWDIKQYLPAETRKFVLNFVALNVIAANYDKFLSKKMNFDEPHLIQLASADSTKPDNSSSDNSL
ncbi:MAG: lytic transglycosylase domain-containing protein [Bacteroidota bacterium]|nr:lytic transglycosylase domain-containing protein [Bacteroidota bacterium]